MLRKTVEEQVPLELVQDLVKNKKHRFVDDVQFFDTVYSYGLGTERVYIKGRELRKPVVTPEAHVKWNTAGFKPVSRRTQMSSEPNQGSYFAYAECYSYTKQLQWLD